MGSKDVWCVRDESENRDNEMQCNAMTGDWCGSVDNHDNSEVGGEIESKEIEKG